ncbi:hypothetical protein ACJX0J_030416, partial [Zea mays]
VGVAPNLGGEGSCRGEALALFGTQLTQPFGKDSCTDQRNPLVALKCSVTWSQEECITIFYDGHCVFRHFAQGHLMV